MIDYKTDPKDSVLESEGTDHDDPPEPGPRPVSPAAGRRPAPLAAQRDRRAARGASGAVGQSPGQGGRAGLAGVREAGPGPGRAVRHRLRLHRRRPDAGHAAAARPAGVRRRAWWSAAGRRPVSSDPPSPRPPGTTWTGWPAAPAGRSPRTGAATASLLRDPSGYPVRVVHGVPELARAARTRPAADELRVRAGCGPTPPSGRPGGRRRSSGWGTWCWAPPGSARPWTGTWTRSG